MLVQLDINTPVDLTFNRENLKKLSKYFDLNFLDSSLEEKKLFFTNLYTLCRIDLSLAHCIQHNHISQLSVQMSSCQQARDYVLSKPYGEVIGCSAQAKRSDQITLQDNVLNGEKRWLSNLDQADYAVIQIESQGKPYMVYVDLRTVPHQVDFNFFTPIGMERAKPGSLIFDNQPIDPACVLGVRGTPEFFLQSSFGSFCFLTNHYGLIKQLFLDVKQYAIDNKCGADLEIKKLEIDVCTLAMMWENSISSLAETTMSNEFWNERNTQYAFSKKTLIKIIQLVLELGVSYYTDAHSKFSQRFRDALTYSTHMHPLYRFGQEFYMLDLTK